MKTFKHSGALGDVIYSIPTIRALTDRAILYLQPDVHGPIPAWAGKRQPQLCTRSQMERLIPLLKRQPLFDDVRLYQGEAVDIDLDLFRLCSFNFGAWSIGRYYQLTLPQANPTFHEPWLTVQPSPDFAGHVLINRTMRYRNPGISYKFLAGRGDVTFVGTAEEGCDFSKGCPRIPCVEAEDALQLAGWIAGCSLFVGNQSFAFSLAEAMKTNRALEVFHPAPNVIVEGPNGVNFTCQEGLTRVIEGLDI